MSTQFDEQRKSAQTVSALYHAHKPGIRFLRDGVHQAADAVDADADLRVLDEFDSRAAVKPRVNVC